MPSKNTPAARMAFGGILAALAIVVMNLGTLIPIAGFSCAVICVLILQLVLRACGERTAWAWYGAVAILGMLLSHDKEAAALFGFLGYYPIVKPRMDGLRLNWLWKGLLFNTSIFIMYRLLMELFGVRQIQEDYREAGTAMIVLLLVLGNVCFSLMDRALTVFRFRGKT